MSTRGTLGETSSRGKGLTPAWKWGNSHQVDIQDVEGEREWREPEADGQGDDRPDVQHGPPPGEHGGLLGPGVRSRQ